MKEIIKNINIVKLSLVFICVLAVCLMCIAVICKMSYVREFDISSARYMVGDEYKTLFDDIEPDAVVLGFGEQDNIFLVSVEKSENFYKETKTTVRVEKVLKGDKSVEGQDVVIYEMCRFDYADRRKDTYFCFYSPNSWNNIMRVGERYLVSVNNFDYSEEYEKTLTLKEFSALDYMIGLYSVPVDSEITFIDPNLIVTDTSKSEVSGGIMIINFEDMGLYKYVKDYDWFCYTEEQAELLEEIRQTILEKYLGE